MHLNWLVRGQGYFVESQKKVCLYLGERAVSQVSWVEATAQMSINPFAACAHPFGHAGLCVDSRADNRILDRSASNCGVHARKASGHDGCVCAKHRADLE
jgi:hypothetical protein